MTTLADAPFEIIGWDINRGGEIKIAFVIAGGDRLVVPGRKLRGALNAAHTQSGIGLVAVQISGETGMRRLFSR